MPIIPVLFLAIFSIGTFLNLFIGPIYGLSVYFVTYFNMPEFQWWSGEVPRLRWSLIASVSLIISCAIKYPYARIIKKIFESPLKYLLLFILYSLITIQFSYSYDLSFAHILYLIKYAVIYITSILVVKSAGKIRAILYLFGVLFLNLSFLGYHYFNGSRLDGVGLSDASDANLLSALVILIIPILIQFIIYGKIYEKILSFVILLPILNVFMMCGSRGGFIGLAVSIIMLLMIQLNKKNILKVTVVVLLFSLLFFSLMGADYSDRLFNLNSSIAQGHMKDSSSGRVSIWIDSAKILKDYPFGVGGGGFMELSPHYLPTELLDEQLGKRACHNTYLLLLIEQGPVGLLLYLTFIWTTFRALFKGKKLIEKINGTVSQEVGEENTFLLSQIKAFISSLSGFWTASFFIDRIYFEGIYIFSALAIAISFIANSRASCAEFEGKSPKLGALPEVK